MNVFLASYNIYFITFSMTYHNDNLEFSHYNIYRETSQFSNVDGLTPIASGRDIQELRDITNDKWTDKFPPSGTGLFYAITIVDHRGVEMKNVVAHQVFQAKKMFIFQREWQWIDLS